MIDIKPLDPIDITFEMECKILGIKQEYRNIFRKITQIPKKDCVEIHRHCGKYQRDYDNMYKNFYNLWKTLGKEKN